MSQSATSQEEGARSNGVESADHDLLQEEISSSGTSWQLRADEARQELLNLASSVGEPTIDLESLRPADMVEVERKLINAALALRLEPDKMGHFIYYLQRVSQDVQSEQGFNPGQIRHAAFNLEALEYRDQLKGSMVGPEHGTVLNVSETLLAAQRQIGRVAKIAAIYESCGMSKAADYEKLLSRLSHTDGPTPPDMMEEARDLESMIGAHYSEAIKRIAEASAGFVNEVFREQVSDSSFALAEDFNDRLARLEAILEMTPELEIWGRRDVEAASKVVSVLSHRFRQVSQSGAYEDDKGPFYYTKLACCDLFSTIVPRTGKLSPDSELKRLLGDQDGRIRVAANIAAENIEQETARLLTHPEESASPALREARMQDLRAVRGTLLLIISARLNRGEQARPGSNAAPLLEEEAESLEAVSERLRRGPFG